MCVFLLYINLILRSDSKILITQANFNIWAHHFLLCRMRKICLIMLLNQHIVYLTKLYVAFQRRCKWRRRYIVLLPLSLRTNEVNQSVVVWDLRITVHCVTYIVFLFLCSSWCPVNSISTRNINITQREKSALRRVNGQRVIKQAGCIRRLFITNRRCSPKYLRTYGETRVPRTQNTKRRSETRVPAARSFFREKCYHRQSATGALAQSRSIRCKSDYRYTYRRARVAMYTFAEWVCKMDLSTARNHFPRQDECHR